MLIFVHSSNEDKICRFTYYIEDIGSLRSVNACMLLLSVCRSLSINIYVLRSILKLNMFFMKVRCIWKTFKSFPNFLRHGFWCPWKRLLCLYDCFWGIKKMSTARRGYMCTKIFNSWNLVTLAFKEHICNFIHFDDPYRTPHKIIPENKHLFKTSIVTKNDN